MDGCGRCGLLKACTANTAKVEYAHYVGQKGISTVAKKELNFAAHWWKSSIDRVVFGGSKNAFDVLAAFLASAELP